VSWFGNWLGGGKSATTVIAGANAATTSTILERCIVLVNAITPASHATVKFRHSQGGGDFREECEAAPAGAFRRFDISDQGSREMFEASSVDRTLEDTTLIITVAYDRSKRAGINGNRDRMRLIDEDWRKINYVIGAYGRANFAGAHDCTPLGAESDIDDSGELLDYLLVTARFTYYLDTNAILSGFDSGFDSGFGSP